MKTVTSVWLAWVSVSIRTDSAQEVMFKPPHKRNHEDHYVSQLTCTTQTELKTGQKGDLNNRSMDKSLTDFNSLCKKAHQTKVQFVVASRLLQEQKLGKAVPNKSELRFPVRWLKQVQASKQDLRQETWALVFVLLCACFWSYIRPSHLILVPAGLSGHLRLAVEHGFVDACEALMRDSQPLSASCAIPILLVRPQQ